jgi:NADPH-dependent FMN reductase
MIDIVGLGGSLAPQSASLAALNVALNGAREYGDSVELFDLRELNLPMYVPGAPVPEAARRLCDATHAAHGCCGAARCITARSAVRSRMRSIGSNCSAIGVEAQTEPLT